MFVGLFTCPPAGHTELDEKVNERGYGLAFQLSPDCMRHRRSMATVESLGHGKGIEKEIQ